MCVLQKNWFNFINIPKLSIVYINSNNMFVKLKHLAILLLLLTRIISLSCYSWLLFRDFAIFSYYINNSPGLKARKIMTVEQSFMFMYIWATKYLNSSLLHELRDSGPWRLRGTETKFKWGWETGQQPDTTTFPNPSSNPILCAQPSQPCAHSFLDPLRLSSNCFS